MAPTPSAPAKPDTATIDAAIATLTRLISANRPAEPTPRPAPASASAAPSSSQTIQQAKPKPKPTSSVGGASSGDAFQTAPKPTAAPLPPPTTHAAPSEPPAPERGPYAFLWNARYFYPIAPAGGIDVNNDDAVETRMIRSVAQHMLDYEKVDDFSITGIDLKRPVGAEYNDLFAVNKNAIWYADVIGHRVDGTEQRVPVVMNADGSTYVDPRIQY